MKISNSKTNSVYRKKSNPLLAANRVSINRAYLRWEIRVVARAGLNGLFQLVPYSHRFRPFQNKDVTRRLLSKNHP